MISRHFSLLTALTLGLFAACTLGEGDGGASDADISRCQGACDQLKFFDCADSGQHAACFDKCESASAEEIDRFDSCVRTDICDPTCPNALPDAGDDGGDDGDDGDGDGDEGGTQTSGCVTACEAVIAAGCFPPLSCEGFCGELTSEQRAFVVACESQRDGCSFPEECAALLDGGGEEGGVSDEGGGGGGDPVDACTDTCDSIHFFDCITADDHAACRSKCGEGDEASIDTFVGCWSGPGVDCEGAACWDTFSAT